MPARHAARRRRWPICWRPITAILPEPADRRREADIVFTWSGVRALEDEPGAKPSRISRSPALSSVANGDRRLRHALWRQAHHAPRLRRGSAGRASRTRCHRWRTLDQERAPLGWDALPARIARPCGAWTGDHSPGDAPTLGPHLWRPDRGAVRATSPRCRLGRRGRARRDSGRARLCGRDRGRHDRRGLSAPPHQASAHPRPGRSRDAVAQLADRPVTCIAQRNYELSPGRAHGEIHRPQGQAISRHHQAHRAQAAGVERDHRRRAGSVGFAEVSVEGSGGTRYAEACGRSGCDRGNSARGREGRRDPGDGDRRPAMRSSASRKHRPRSGESSTARRKAAAKPPAPAPP